MSLFVIRQDILYLTKKNYLSPMANRVFIVLVFLFVFSYGFSQQDTAVRKRLVILHPTALILDYYNNLIVQKILPDTIEYIGVYNTDESYDYSKIEKYADSVGMKIRFIPVRGSLDAKDVYAKNVCTPVFEYLFKISSGVIFNGGPDIQPELYGAETSLMTEITDPGRHFFEMSFMFHLLGSTRNPEFTPLIVQKPDYMILGICLGMQTLVTVTGGTLVQDIPTEIYKKKTVEQVLSLPGDKQHKNYYKVKYPKTETVAWGSLHSLYADAEFSLWNDCKLTNHVQVYSYHHQSAKKLPPTLKAVAWSADKKVIEAVTHKQYPNVLGIQFHPEPDFLHQPLKRTYLAEGDNMTIGRLMEKDKGTMLFLRSFWSGIVKRLK